MSRNSNIDRTFVARSLELAAHGIGLVSPNPLVGCVIVNADGKVVGEGTYTYDGVTHAEVIALEQAGEEARGGTAYVSLEPHHHQGRTPPCTEALIEAGITRVVSPIQDPNPLVSGRGFKRLREAGIKVTTGILASEASRLNEKFICWHKQERPFVHLKLAMSLDGRISLTSSVSTALSGETAIRRVHELRHEHDAILIGANTVIADDPKLTDRSDRPRRRPLVRIVLDNRLRTPRTAKVVTTASAIPTVLFTNSSNDEKLDALRTSGVAVIHTPAGARELTAVLGELKEREIQSVLVEGGSEVAGAFVDAKLVDKISLIVSPLIIGGREAPAAIAGQGVESLAEAVRLRGLSVTMLDGDVEITGYPKGHC